MKGKFVVKTNTGNFNAVAPDMKLEQTIQKSKKGTGGIIGQTKKDSFVTEWHQNRHYSILMHFFFIVNLADIRLQLKQLNRKCRRNLLKRKETLTCTLLGHSFG